MRYRPEWLSEGAEVLVARLQADPTKVYDVVVVGSGYGGAVAAARFAGATDARGHPLEVCVLERGNEYVVGAFPNRLSDLPGYVRYSRHDDPQPKGRRDGLFDLRIGADVSVVLASGLGGGSLINAAVAERATAALEHPAWPEAIRGDLDRYYARAEAMLGVNGVPREYPKSRAFREFVSGLSASGMTVDRARPTRVAISFQSRAPNAQGVAQEACIGCGDCVTGCNFGAKNTLAMNYLPHARRRGAELYTGATVLYLEQATGDDGARWSVAFRLTRDKGPDKLERPSRVRARQVVLAAGTFGSPEILARSRRRGLALSGELGQRFSANGDMISALYGQRERVRSSAPEHEPFAGRGVGPTITGIAEARAADGSRLVLEELAIPGALRRLFEEVLTTAALAARLDEADWSPHAARYPDPAAVDPRAIDCTQIFAAFGDDCARGTLKMVEGWESFDWDGAIAVAWSAAGEQPVYQQQDRLLSSGAASDGRYLRSPLWRPLPEALSAALSGPKPSGKLLSVHPLGGCPMGSSHATGVVDHVGRVFDLKGSTSTYDGLLVLDGSIVPTALGTNPLLTIAALAERAVEVYAGERHWDLRLDQPYSPAQALRAGPPQLAVLQPAKAETRIRLAERMTGPLTLGANCDHKVDCELLTEFGAIGPIPGFLREPAHRVEIENARLTAADASVPVSGSVYWLERGRSGALRRTARALWTWLVTRGVADLIQRIREEGLGALKGLSLSAIVRLATNVGEVRYLRYELSVDADLRAGQRLLLRRGTRITGLKTFQYAYGGNPWKQLSELSVSVTTPAGFAWHVGTLKLDPMHFVRRYAVQLQAVEQADAATTLVDLASIALFMARLILKIHFWSFRLPEYENLDPQRDKRRLPRELRGLERSVHQVPVPVDADPNRRLELPLTNYRRKGVDPARLKGPVVLFHGFGSSGAQFAFRGWRLPRNLVTHLAEQGFDVWVPELRTSIGVPSSWEQWTLDEVAMNDIPAMIDAVLRATGTGSQQVDVVAHCIGSAMFCTSVLAGRLARADAAGGRTSKVRRAVLLQVGPLVTLSETNKFNARLISFLRRYAQVEHVDSSIERERADWVDALVDRLLNTYPYPPAEAKHHHLCPPWVRRTHIANCNRSAAVFGRLFNHANVGTAMLDSLGDLLGHTNLTTFEQTLQYAFLERLTDQNATNAYVTRENVRDHFAFPVRFVHGTANAVFDYATSERSFRLLTEVHGAGAAELVPLPGFGHLDPLIGRNAPREVFPKIAEFLLADAPVEQRARRVVPDPSRRFGRRPLVGPVLGWTRREGGEWRARVWCRADDTRRDPSFVMTIAYGNPPTAQQRDLRALAPPPGLRRAAADRGARLDGIETLVAVDVPLGAQSADVEILVATAYPGPEPTVDAHARLIEAERATWRDDVRRGERPGLTAADDGYDARMDSVAVPKAVLDALDPNRTSVSFALASCRYSARVVDREMADFMFGKLRALLADGAPHRPALLLLVGDQIYADATAGVFDPKSARERFYESYHEAWTAPNARAVLRQLPTYMMMDDHEVADNWSPGETDGDTEKWGLEAFEGYQWLHSPRNAAELRRDNAAVSGYFYSFDAAGFPFFVCDTRTTRSPPAEIMEKPQLRALKEWLSAHDKPPHRHKFVVSPSLVVPFRKDAQRRGRDHPDAYLRRSDGWEAFPTSLRELMAYVLEHKVRNVVFLCGDAHVSMASRIWFEHQGQVLDLGTRCIVSSPLYAPFPFANSRAEEFAPAGELDLGGGARMHYAITGEMIERDSFAVVHADARATPPALQVAFHVRDRQAPIDLTLPGVAPP
jgi:choline dehydrogenase-like flavoprotein